MLMQPQARRPPRPFPLAARARALAVILSEEFGIPFRFYDAADGQAVPLPEAPAGLPPHQLTPEVVRYLADKGQSAAACQDGGRYQVALVLYDAQRPTLVAQGLLAGLAAQGSDWVVEQGRLQKWLQ